MKVRKAVIPAAGLGTRFLPASKAVPKNLIPVVDKPMIQFAVEELARAGITDVCFVVSKETSAVVDHFRTDEELERALEEAGKSDLLERVREIDRLPEVVSVYQEEPLGLGHAVGCARDWVGDEPFAVLLPDELYDPRRDLVGELISTFEARSASAIAVCEVPQETIDLYGSISSGDLTASPITVDGVVEKPSPEEAPSNLAITGRYVLVPEIFDIIDGLEPGAGGEIQLTDGLAELAGRGELFAVRYDGRRWDVGSKEGWLKAVVELALDDPDLGKEFGRFLEELKSR